MLHHNPHVTGGLPVVENIDHIKISILGMEILCPIQNVKSWLNHEILQKLSAVSVTFLFKLTKIWEKSIILKVDLDEVKK